MRAAGKLANQERAKETAGGRSFARKAGNGFCAAWSVGAQEDVTPSITQCSLVLVTILTGWRRKCSHHKL